MKNNLNAIIQNNPPNDNNTVNREPLVNVSAIGKSIGKLIEILIPCVTLSNVIKNIVSNISEINKPINPALAMPSDAIKFAFAFSVGIFK